jgi:hypothetical protein
MSVSAQPADTATRLTVAGRRKEAVLRDAIFITTL